MLKIDDEWWLVRSGDLKCEINVNKMLKKRSKTMYGLSESANKFEQREW